MGTGGLIEVRVRALASGAFACVGEEAETEAGTEACDSANAAVGEESCEECVELELEDEGKNDLGEPFPPCDADEGEDADDAGRTMGLMMHADHMAQTSKTYQISIRHSEF